MFDDAEYLLAKASKSSGSDRIKMLRQLHVLVETQLIIERIRAAQ